MAGTRGGATAGTRGGPGRVAAMVIGLVVVLVLVAAGVARAGTYEVAQCGWGLGAELDPSAARAEGDAFFLHPTYCTQTQAGRQSGMAFEAGYAFEADQGIARARWVAPSGTSFAAARFVWEAQQAPGFWYVAGVDDGTGYYGFAWGVSDVGATQVSSAVPRPAGAFEVRFECLNPQLLGCDRSEWSLLTLRDLILSVEDPSPPAARLGGALVAGGWHRGTVPLELAAEDPVGAGISGLSAGVDGTSVLAAGQPCAVATIEGAVLATKLRPCPPTAAAKAEVDTTKLADGTHAVRGCANDFGADRGCAPEAEIEVDNSPPEIEFAAAPEGQVAATVSDAFSGPAAGMISVRRADSETWADLPTTFAGGAAGTAKVSAALPDLSAGAYFFRATATDAAGNTGSAQFRASGTPAELRRQIAGGESASGRPGGRATGRKPAARGRATYLSAHLVAGARGRRTDRGAARSWLAAPRSADAGGPALAVDFGTGVEVRGRLTSHGKAVAGRSVSIVAREVVGAGGAPQSHRVTTGGDGGFALSLPPGTSRDVVVSFGGGGGFAPARRRSLALRVRAGVSLAAVPSHLRTGERVTLSGQVRSGPARIPARGKLITIQYLERASHRWRPALVVRTGARGHFKARYRFRYIHGAARILLRATALPEAGWPYAAGSSDPVTVTVHGR